MNKSYNSKSNPMMNPVPGPSNSSQKPMPIQQKTFPKTLEQFSIVISLKKEIPIGITEVI